MWRHLRMIPWNHPFVSSWWRSLKILLFHPFWFVIAEMALIANPGNSFSRYDNKILSINQLQEGRLSKLTRPLKKNNISISICFAMIWWFSSSFGLWNLFKSFPMCHRWSPRWKFFEMLMFRVQYYVLETWSNIVRGIWSE